MILIVLKRRYHKNTIKNEHINVLLYFKYYQLYTYYTFNNLYNTLIIS